MHKNLLLGAHISIAGGAQNALYKGASIGCNAIQIFTQSNRQWGFKTFSDEEIQLFTQAKEKTGIDSILSHASYLINLASLSMETRKKSLEALKGEMLRCAQLGIKKLVLHPGSGNPQDAALKYIIDGINEALVSTDSPKTQILLELMAGQGSSKGSTFEELAVMIEGIEKKEYIGVCFDTCHAWAAGYDFTSKAAYEKMWKEFDAIVGIDYLQAFHLNDSLKPHSCHVDRHADIGKGTIGLEAFKNILQDERFFAVPKIIETPKRPHFELEDDEKNLNVLQTLLEK